MTPVSAESAPFLRRRVYLVVQARICGPWWQRVDRPVGQEGGEMCLSAPAQILAVDDPFTLRAIVQLGETQRTVSIGFLAETEVAAGDWVLVQAGIALRRIDAEEAAAILDQLVLVDAALAELNAADVAVGHGRAEWPRQW